MKTLRRLSIIFHFFVLSLISAQLSISPLIETSYAITIAGFTIPDTINIDNVKAEDFNKLSSSQRQTVLAAYNAKNGTSFNEQQFVDFLKSKEAQAKQTATSATSGSGSGSTVNLQQIANQVNTSNTSQNQAVLEAQQEQAALLEQQQAQAQANAAAAAAEFQQQQAQIQIIQNQANQASQQQAAAQAAQSAAQSQVDAANAALAQAQADAEAAKNNNDSAALAAAISAQTQAQQQQQAAMKEVQAAAQSAAQAQDAVNAANSSLTQAQTDAQTKLDAANSASAAADLAAQNLQTLGSGMSTLPTGTVSADGSVTLPGAGVDVTAAGANLNGVNASSTGGAGGANGGCPDGKTLNASAGVCVTPTENLILTAAQGECASKTGSAKSECETNLQAKVDQFAPNGGKDAGSVLEDTIMSNAGPDCEATLESSKCQSQGNTWNCQMNVCLTPDEQAKYATAALDCQLKPGAEKDKCMDNMMEDVAKDQISGGGVCLAESSRDLEANTCRAAGKVWNCEFGQCISQEVANGLANSAVGCFKKTGDAKDSCMNDLKEDTVRRAALGEFCEEADKKAECAAQGKTWNCNVGMCLDSFQNDAIADEAVTCQMKDSDQEKDMCMAELEKNGPAIIATACDISDNPTAQQCREGGNVWNCMVAVCADEDMNNRMVNAWVNCENKPSEQEKAECMAELGELAAAAQMENQITAEDLENPGNPMQVGYMIVMALSALAVTISMTVATTGGFCFASVINILASLMSMMAEKDTEKNAKKQMEDLKKQFQEIADLQADKVVTYDIQYKAIQFYYQAAMQASALARQYADTYDSATSTFNMAAAIATVEAIIYAWTPPNWPSFACAVASGAIALIGAGLTGKASSTANKLADDFDKMADKAKRILDLFDKHFNNYGGADASSNNFAALKPQDNPNAQLGTINGTNQNLANNETEAGTLEANEAGNNASAATCINSKNQLDSSCDCKKNNSCFNVDLTGFTSTKLGADAAQALDLENQVNDLNRVSNGEVALSDLDHQQMLNRLKRNRNAVRSLAKQANSRLKDVKDFKGFHFPDNKELAAFINKNAKQSAIGSRSFGSKFFGGQLDPSELAATTDALDEQLKNDGKTGVKQKVVKTALGSFKMPSLSFEDLDTLNDSEREETYKIKNSDMMNSSMNAKQLAELNDVHSNSTKNLWEIITKRYHIITKQKRIGTFRKRRKN